MNYFYRIFGYDNEEMDNRLIDETNFIQYTQFSECFEDTPQDAPNSTNHKMFVHIYVNIIKQYTPPCFITLPDETIISDGIVINPIHFITELIKSCKSDEQIDNLLIADLPRSEVKLHILSNDVQQEIHITNLIQFKNILSEYNTIFFKSTKAGNNELKNLSLSKLILTFSNQSSMPPIIMYANILFPDKFLCSTNPMVNYDIIIDNTRNKIILQSSVNKTLVTSLFELNNPDDPELIFSINITLNLQSTTFAVESVKFINYDSNR